MTRQMPSAPYSKFRRRALTVVESRERLAFIRAHAAHYRRGLLLGWWSGNDDVADLARREIAWVEGEVASHVAFLASVKRSVVTRSSARGVTLEMRAAA